MVGHDAHRIDILRAIYDSAEGEYIGQRGIHEKSISMVWGPKMFNFMSGFIASCKDY